MVNRIQGTASEISVNGLLLDLIGTLKLIRKTLEPLATQDSLQRQRVVVESITGINSTIGSAASTAVNIITSGGASPTFGNAVSQQVWEGPVDQRYRVADAARTMAYIQRQNITFS